MKLFLSCPEEASDEKEWPNLSPFYTPTSTSVMLINTPGIKFDNEQPHPEHLSLARVPLPVLPTVLPLVKQSRALEERKPTNKKIQANFRWRWLWDTGAEDMY